MTHVLLWLVLLYAASAFGQAASAQPKQPPTVARACDQCDAVVRRVLSLLPTKPALVKVIDLDSSAKVLQEKFKHTVGFVTPGDPAVYLTKQGSTFQQALRGPGIWDYALAITVWHEMAHLAGADEHQAREKEEELWAEFIVAGRVDTGRGIAYLGLLRGRPSNGEETSRKALAFGRSTRPARRGIPSEGDGQPRRTIRRVTRRLLKQS